MNKAVRSAVKSSMKTQSSPKISGSRTTPGGPKGVSFSGIKATP